MKPKLTSQSGLTILEVLVAMGILLIGMSAVLGLLMTGASLSRSAILRTTAAAASEAVVADLEETMFPLEGDTIFNSQAGEPLPVVDRKLAGASKIVYSATPEVNPDRPSEYRVDIELSWEAAGVRRARRFSTLLIREIPFGERLRREFVEGGQRKSQKTKEKSSSSDSNEGSQGEDPR